MTLISEDYDETFAVIRDMAKVKMVMNSHKGRIEDLPPKEILDLLYGEVAELVDAADEDDLRHVIEDAADVHNFLVALVHQAIARYRGRKKNEN